MGTKKSDGMDMIGFVRISSNTVSTSAYYAEKKLQEQRTISEETIEELEDIAETLLSLVDRLKSFYQKKGE